MEDEKLIEFVRQHEELYNLAHSQYSNNSLKDKLWNEIANELNHTAAVCKTRWNNIRDNFRKNLKKRIGKPGQLRKFSKYRYEDQLSFLVPFIKEKEFLGVLGRKRAADDEIDDFDCGSDNNEERYLEPAINIKSENISANNGESSSKRKENVTAEKVASEFSSASATLMKYLLEQSEKSKRKSADPVDAFLAGLAPTLKSFSPYQLNMAKSKMFNVVQEIELTQIMCENYESLPGTISSPSPIAQTSIASPAPSPKPFI